MATAQSKSTPTAAKAAKKPFSIISAKDLGLTVRVQISPVAFANWSRALLLGWRQGTVACKGRSDVNRTNKKPWKQKGTGRARAGSARSPLWRGGGVTFGPQARTRIAKIPVRIRQSVKNCLLWSCIDEKRLMALDWQIKGDAPKTAQAYAALKGAGLADKKVVLFLQPDDLLTRASFVNLPDVTVVLMDEVNAFHVGSEQHWVVLKKDMDSFKQMVAQWV